MVRITSAGCMYEFPTCRLLPIFLFLPQGFLCFFVFDDCANIYVFEDFSQCF